MTTVASAAIAVDAEALAGALALTRSVISDKTHVPILAFVRITIVAGVLTVDATDLGVAVRTTLPIADVGASLDVAAPARALAAALASRTGTALLSSDGGRFIVDIDPCRFELRALPATEYPVLPMLRDEAAAAGTVSTVALARFSSNAKPYVGKQGANAPTCVAEDGELVLYASDGRTATRWAIGPDCGGFDPPVPFDDGLLRVASTLRPAQGSVSLERGKTAILVRFGATVIASRIGGRAVDCARLRALRGLRSHAFTIADVASAVAALRRVGTIGYGAKVLLSVGSGKLRIAAVGHGPSASATVPATGNLDEVQLPAESLRDAMAVHVRGPVTVDRADDRHFIATSATAESYFARPQESQ